jgi:hypothetical protein
VQRAKQRDDSSTRKKSQAQLATLRWKYAHLHDLFAIAAPAQRKHANSTLSYNGYSAVKQW